MYIIIIILLIIISSTPSVHLVYGQEEKVHVETKLNYSFNPDR